MEKQSLPINSDSENPKAPTLKTDGVEGAHSDRAKLMSDGCLEEFWILVMTRGASVAPSLNLSEALYLVFVAWKLGRLSSLETQALPLWKHLPPEELALVHRFLQAHRLRLEGQIEQGFRVLEELVNKDQPHEIHWILRFRFTAEAINFYDLTEAHQLLLAHRGALPSFAQKVLSFNLGIVALNQGDGATYRTMESQFEKDSEPLAQFFFTWLQGSFFQHQGNPKASTEFYLQALEGIERLPSRQTDMPILAFLVLQQSVWAGDFVASRQAWLALEKARQNKINLDPQSLSLAKALFELNEGKMTEALIRLEALFEQRHWTRDHLRGGDFYLWILVAQSEPERGLRLIETLSEVRRNLGFSEMDLDQQVLSLYFQWRKNTLTVTELKKGLLKLKDALNLKGHQKGAQSAEFLFHLFLEDTQERYQAFTVVSDTPFFQRIGISVLSQFRLIPSVFRNLRVYVSDELAQWMLDLHLSRLTEDLLLFVKTFKCFAASRTSAWVELLSLGESRWSGEFGRRLQNTELLLDGESRRVICLENLETLDSQPLLTELALALFRYPKGLSKELATLGIGYSTYDPIQHDPIVYNLVSRLRDWLRKQGASVSIATGRAGWTYTHRELVHCFYRENENHEEPAQVTGLGVEQPLGSEWSPRSEWILASLDKKGFLKRSDLLKRFDIQKSTAANDFNELIEKNKITRHGHGRGIYYTLKEAGK